MMYVAYSLGQSVSWTGPFDEEKARKVFSNTRSLPGEEVRLVDLKGKVLEARRCPDEVPA